MTAHAFFPPSGAEQTVHCAAWPTMNALYPQPDTQDSMDGTAVHWAGAELYHRRLVVEGQVAPNGVVLTEEMIEAAETWAGALHPHEWTVERPVGDRNSLSWGTPDARRIEGGVLRVKDLKFGFGPVDAYEWWQGIDYTRLLVQQYPMLDRDDTPVELEIIQPRVYRRRDRNVWETTLGKLRTYFERILHAHEAALAPEPVATAGPHCKHCPGRLYCPTNQAAALDYADTSGQSAPMELLDGALGREAAHIRRAIKVMQSRLTGLEADIEARLRAGRSVPWHALVPGESREVWAVELGTAIEVAASVGVDIAKPGALTPNQARKAGMSAELVASLSHRPPAGMKLVEDDGRTAAKVFDGAIKTS